MSCNLKLTNEGISNTRPSARLHVPLQALAIEKLLLVTSTVPQTQNPPELPKLSSLLPVNENPKTPALPPCPKPVASVTSPQANGLPHDRLHFHGNSIGVAGAALGTLASGPASPLLPDAPVRPVTQTSPGM